MEDDISVRLARNAIGMSQRGLAERACVPLSDLMLAERGLASLSTRRMEAVAHALGVDPTSIGDFAPIAGEGYVTAIQALSNGLTQRREAPNASLRPVMDLFCGVGGFSTGFESTGEFEVIAGIDLLGDRLETFCSNHSAANGYGGDIRNFDVSSLMNECPTPFVIIGGPPCQGFSSIRPFRNIEWSDPRNNLGEEFCRVIASIRPEWLVFENVVGLLNHRSGKTFEALMGAFEALGYRVSARVLNAAYHGLPQRRERLLVVGSLKGKPFEWPTATHRHDKRSMVGRSNLLITPDEGLFDNTSPALTLMDAIDDLPPVQSGGNASEYVAKPRNRYQEVLRFQAEVLTLHEATMHSDEMLNIIKHAGSSIAALPPGLVTSGFSTSYSRLAADEPSNTITVNFVHPASNRCIHPFQQRALTPREGARLQSFPDTFVFKGNRTQVVKQIGNAVPPLLGKLIAEAILDAD